MAWWKVGRWGSHSLKAILLSGLLWTILGFTNSEAGYAADCPADNVDECTRYQHIVAGINSSDFVAQITSLRAASEELDPSLRALVFETALKSPNIRLRTAGLRYVLSSRKNFDIAVEPPPHLTREQQKNFQPYSSFTLRDLKLDEKSDEITAVISSMSVRATGSIIRGGFELSWPYCRLHMLAGEEDAIRGTLQCSYPNGISVEAKTTIELG